MAAKVTSTNTAQISLHPLPATESRVGLKKSKIYELIQEGKFPKPIKVGGRSLWPSTAIDAWIGAQIAGTEMEAA